MEDQQEKSIIFKTLTRLFSIQTVGLGCGFLVHLLLARLLSPSEYGIYNFVFSISMICALVGNFGFQASAVRLIPNMIIDEDKKGLKNFLGFSTIWIFFLSSALSIIIYFGLNAIGFTDEYPKESLLTGIALTPLLALIKLNSGILKGFKKGATALAFESSLKEILFLICLVSLILSSLIHLTAYSSLIIVTTIIAILFLVSFFYILKNISNFKSSQIIGSKSNYRHWLQISFPMMLVISVQFLILRSDVIMLGFLTSSEDVGVYSAGAKIAQASTITMMVLNIFFSPRAAELFHNHKKIELRSLYFKTLRYQAISTLGLIAILAIISPYILQFLGSDYSDALPVTYVLLFGFGLNALWGPIPFFMIMTDYEYQAMWITFSAAALNIILNLILIPTYGIVGAAIATMLAINLRNGFAVLYIFSQGILRKNG